MDRASAEWLKNFINEHDPELFADAQSDGVDASPFARAAWYVICQSRFGDERVVYDGVSGYVMDVLRAGGPLEKDLLAAWEEMEAAPAQKFLSAA